MIFWHARTFYEKKIIESLFFDICVQSIANVSVSFVSLIAIELEGFYSGLQIDYLIKP